MPARSLGDGAMVGEDSEEDLSFLPPTINMGRKRLRGPLSLDLVDSLRTAAASLAVASPHFAGSSDNDSDDELLMDVEVRTSGPDSGLITNKSELKDDDDDDTCNNDEEVINPLQIDDRLCTDNTKCVQNGNANETNNLSVTKIYTAEKIPLHSNENKDMSAYADTSFGLIGLSSKEINKDTAKFGIPVSKFREATISSIDETYSDTSGDLHHRFINDTRINPFSTANVTAFAKGKGHERGICNSHEIVECKSPPQSSKPGLDNSSLSKVIEVALAIETNDCAFVTKSIDLMSTNEGIKRNCGTNGYNSCKFPRLKQMLTSGVVSEATTQFSKEMSLGNPYTQGPNHLHNSGKERDRLDCFVNHNQVSNHSDMVQGTNEDNRASIKRSRADDCDTICKENAYLPPKKSKCFFTNLESFTYQNGFSSARAFDSRDEHKDENKYAENTYKQTVSQ